MKKAVLTYTLLLLISFCATAQKATFEFFTTADGLSGNNTSSVTQDDQGFIWFVNDDKLHRYDGRNFVVYPTPRELSAGREHLLGLASWQDSLLFVWSEHYPFLFNPKTGNWQHIELKEKDSKNDGRRFWKTLGQANSLMSRVKKGFGVAYAWSSQKNKLTPARLSKPNPLLSTYYWSGMDAFDYTLSYVDTLYQVDKSGHTQTVTPLGNICTDCYNLNFQTATDGTIKLLVNFRFYQLDKAKNRFVPHPANRFLQASQAKLLRFVVEKNGSIWACGYDRALIYYDAVNDTLYDFHDELKRLLPNRNDFKGLFQDRTGIVWVDTRLGLLKVRPKSNPFDTYFSGLNQANAYYSFRGFTEDAKGLIYGVYYEGIATLDPAKKRPQRNYTFSPILNLFDLATEGDRVWINGGQLLNPKSGQLTNVPSAFLENPYSDNGFFAKDKNGTLWWASHYFLYRLDKLATGFHWRKELELSEKIFNKTDALHVGAKSGKLWLSFNGKLLQYDPKTKKQHWLDLRNGELSISRITTIQEDRNGKLWLGTDAGLVYIDPVSGTRKHYTVNEGLPNNFICGLLTEGDSCLWLSTNHGLSRFHIPTRTFINFLEEDGLTYNEFNRKSYFKAHDGRMFFGGMRGVNAFFPKEVMQTYRNRDQSAQLVLTSFEHTDERLDTVLREINFARKPKIQIYNWDWSYTFEYALTDYDNPSEIFYSYKMEGYKDSWSPPSKFNFTRFNSLPSGEYVFRVKARDSRGRWHPNELAVIVVVHPPWWATWWAYLTYFLLLLGIAYGIYSFLKKRLLLQNELKLEQQEAQRLKELDQFKSRLYTNLTHEFRTPLTVILGMVGQIRSQPGKYLDEGARLIENNSQNLLRLVNQLLDLSKLENKSFQLNVQLANIEPYLRYITESFQTFANSQNLSLRFVTTSESLVMDYDPEQIKQVLTNLISNALKFTPSGGDIRVRMVEAGDQLIIEVQDTGIGIADNDLPHVFDRFYQVDGSHTRQGEGTGIGLAHTQELVKLMGGQINVKSELGIGTTFSICIPVTRNAPESDRRASIQDPVIEVIASNHPLLLPDESIHHSSLIAQHSSLPHLLLIEDNSDIVIYLKSCLEGLYQVDVAYNGKIGIEKALESIPDIIISDVMMPEKDGYQVCDVLKNDERTSHIPIILLTAKAGTDARLTGLKRGADAYLTKPFHKEELLVQLAMLVEKQKRLIAHFSKKQLIEAPAPVIEQAVEDAFALEDAFVQKVAEIVAENFADDGFGLLQLCQTIGMSRSQLFRKMKALMDTSPSDFIRSYRLTRAKLLLETTDLSVSEVAWRTGYKNPSHFSTSFQEEFRIAPSEIRK
ncbi:helix-turn-helix domain-containing protein [Spirosoma sp. KCTC 42546]|uniref:hybrid sensor histidine kinase/response regulator transcription factor n=1 Tax=Spirosoma sp. KCTC 42546 TaxID=2520506 RepID=UPI00115C420C|nr:ATP-binding protein [Spirosoma sp. KCTC 42546]QDK78527.1 helix-turn-helix domain-containing protein [Spirosoma sp. KCTC 42546]